jgi:hypothetical protein
MPQRCLRSRLFRGQLVPECRKRVEQKEREQGTDLHENRDAELRFGTVERETNSHPHRKAVLSPRAHP